MMPTISAVRMLTLALINDPDNHDCANDLITVTGRSDDFDVNMQAMNMLHEAFPELLPHLLQTLCDTGPEASRKRSLVGIAKDTPDDPVYQLKIALERTSPPIWRRVMVPGHFVFT